MKRNMPKLGAKVRALRRREGLSQAQLAERMQISASYLNLIEHNRRALTAPLLIKLAQLFDLDLRTFSEDSAVQVTGDLLEVFGDPMFDGFSLTNVDIKELASANSQLARAVVALYHAYRHARESADAIAAHLAEDDEVSPTGRVQLPSEEVNDVFQRRYNVIIPLEEAAEAVSQTAELDPSGDKTYGLKRHLSDAYGVTVEVGRPADMHGAVRRYHPRRRLLVLSEVLRPGSRNFQMAHVLCLLSHSELLEELVADEHLSSDESRALCRVAMANYFAGAVLMPYRPFLLSAQEERYDLELLSHRFNVGFEQVAHRLTTLQRPGNRGVPLHLVRIDVAGNISKRFSASGLRFARFSASCPLWNVHAAFQTPGKIRVQLSQMPNGDTFLCAARTLRRGGGGYSTPEALQALSIGCDVSDARALVYSDGIDLESEDRIVKVGVTCQVCERPDCPQRAVPQIHRPLRIDENVRGVSFFSPVG